MNDKEVKRDILYSCYHKLSRQGENFVAQHTLTYQLSGTFLLTDGKEDYLSNADSLHLIRRNQLLKFTKYPPPEGEFKSLNIFLSETVLKNFSMEYNISIEHMPVDEPIIAIEMNPLLQSFIYSLQVLHDTSNLHNQLLVDLKIKEVLLILLQTQPQLKNILFDFTEPHKIDLEAFMNQNYYFNVKLERFAYLTGRSLATFKRDFEKIFNASPHKWLLQKRLNEAHYLIREQNKTASDIYLDLGFEDLSHFSYAFKKQFGEAPSKLMLHRVQQSGANL